MQKFIYIILAACFISCNQGPKVIETTEPGSESGIFGTAGEGGNTTASSSPAGSFSKDLHQVRVLEVLPTEKYVYLRVEEEGVEEAYWIATRKQEVSEGGVYFYRGGLLKTQFESKEYNRVFDRVYLVSNIVPANHARDNTAGVNGKQEIDMHGKDSNTETVTYTSDATREASIRIDELVKNKTAYEGQSVQLTGTVTKVNPNIMGRNWIHLKDGSRDDYDLVITSDVAIPEGHEVSLRGVVSLNRDFGAGYTYDILVENAELVR